MEAIRKLITRLIAFKELKPVQCGPVRDARHRMSSRCSARVETVEMAELVTSVVGEEQADAT